MEEQNPVNNLNQNMDQLELKPYSPNKINVLGQYFTTSLLSSKTSKRLEYFESEISLYPGSEKNKNRKNGKDIRIKKIRK